MASSMTTELRDAVCAEVITSCLLVDVNSIAIHMHIILPAAYTTFPYTCDWLRPMTHTVMPKQTNNGMNAIGPAPHHHQGGGRNNATRQQLMYGEATHTYSWTEKVITVGPCLHLK